MYTTKWSFTIIWQVRLSSRLEKIGWKKFCRLKPAFSRFWKCNWFSIFFSTEIWRLGNLSCPLEATMRMIWELWKTLLKRSWTMFTQTNTTWRLTMLTSKRLTDTPSRLPIPLCMPWTISKWHFFLFVPVYFGFYIPIIFFFNWHTSFQWIWSVLRKHQ